MVYGLLQWWIQDVSWLNILRYITFRSGAAWLTATLISLFFMPWMIRRIRTLYADGQPIRDDGPESHLQTKRGTPTMGGLMILGSSLISIGLWGDWQSPYLWIATLSFVGFGLIGWLDDIAKVRKRNSRGISGRGKLLGQSLLALMIAITGWSVMPPEFQQHLALPFLKGWYWNMGWLFVPWVVLVIVGSSNAVNLTDGLDGLAVVPVMMALSCFGLFSYLTGHAVFAEYLHLHTLPGSGEMAVLCGAALGGCLGFLWYNAQPAEIFMGDTGSLALGGLLGTLAVLTKHEIVLAVVGGVFVMEALSVILQVGYFKWTKGRRLFRMAPLHHHFEKMGWPESKVVVRFWILSVMFALCGLATLKIR
jgi:phospho-N-acetylmuramoyl-pentapeptide-transferase